MRHFSTTNANLALNKLPLAVRLEWNKNVLDKNLTQTSLEDLSKWLSHYAQACRDLPTNLQRTETTNSSNNKNCNDMNKSWNSNGRQTDWRSFSNNRQQTTGNNNKNFLSNNRQQAPINKKQNFSIGNICPRNEQCAKLYRCPHFQDLSPKERKEHIYVIKLCSNYFGKHRSDLCKSKNPWWINNCGKKHHFMLHDSFSTSSTPVKTAEVRETG